jgi:drug/metabolite transporter (DMT)-like permease
MVMVSPIRTDAADRTMAGIVMTLCAMMIFSGMDGISKLLAEEYQPFEIAFVRNVVTFLVLAPFVARSSASLRTSRPLHQIGRGLCMVASSIFFISGLSRLPIADATAIGFVAPLLVTALSIPFLGEKVGIRRWSAVIVGFIGVLVVVRPGTGAFDPAAIYPLLSAAAWALGLILTRLMRASEPALMTTFYSTIVGAAACAVTLPFVWTTPDLTALALMIVMGVLSAIGQYLFALALTQTAASLLAPFSYSQMLWSTLVGYFFFATVPDAVTWVGAAIVIASGLYTLHRESVVHRQRMKA